MKYNYVFPAYPGPWLIGVDGPDGVVWFDTWSEAQMFFNEANDTPEWQAYCLEAIA